MTKWHFEHEAEGIAARANIKTVEGGRFQLDYVIDSWAGQPMAGSSRRSETDFITRQTFDAVVDLFVRRATAAGIPPQIIVFEEST